MAQLARMSAVAEGSGAAAIQALVAEVDAISEAQYPSGTRLNLSNDEASASAQSLLDLALAAGRTDGARAQELVREAEALAEVDGPMDRLDRERTGRTVSSVQDQLQGSMPGDLVAVPQPPGFEALARNGAWEDAIGQVAQGSFKSPWVWSACPHVGDQALPQDQCLTRDAGPVDEEARWRSIGWTSCDRHARPNG